MKKICFVKQDMQDASGGARVCANLANALADIYEVHVVSICSEKEDTFYKLNANVKYKVLIKGEGRIRELLLKGVPRLRKYLKQNQIDIAFSVGVSINPFVIPATKGIHCKAVSCEHMNCLNSFGNDRSQRFCRYLGAKFGNKIITLTKMDKESYIKKYHLKENKVEYIYNWMDESLFSDDVKYNIESKQIITVARLEKVKGIENVIKVSKRLKEKYNDWQWHIYGGGEQSYIDELEKQIKQNELQNFVMLKGKVNDIYDRYKDYSIFVLTSYSEGLPMVLLEAKSKKLPIISFDCLTGPRDIIRDGIDGYLIPVDDIEMLYQKLDLCMSSKEERIRLSEQSYGNISLFSKNIILKKWVNFINNCN